MSVTPITPGSTAVEQLDATVAQVETALAACTEAQVKLDHLAAALQGEDREDVEAWSRDIAAQREELVAVRDQLADKGQSYPLDVAQGRGQRCGSCGEYEGVTTDHGPWWEALGFPVRRHSVCRNCDYGLCSGEC